jgi:hypothetical protein
MKKDILRKIRITNSRKPKERQIPTIQKGAIQNTSLIQKNRQVIIQIKTTISNNLKITKIKKKILNQKGSDKSNFNKLK